MSDGNYQRRAWHRTWNVHQGHTGWYTEQGIVQVHISTDAVVGLWGLDGQPVDSPLEGKYDSLHESFRAVEKWLDEGKTDD